MVMNKTIYLKLRDTKVISGQISHLTVKFHLTRRYNLKHFAQRFVA